MIDEILFDRKRNISLISEESTKNKKKKTKSENVKDTILKQGKKPKI